MNLQESFWGCQAFIGCNLRNAVLLQWFRVRSWGRARIHKAVRTLGTRARDTAKKMWVQGFPLLDQWFSTFLMLWPFNTGCYVVVTPTMLLSSLSHDCKFCYFCDSYCNYMCFLMVLRDPGERVVQPPEGSRPTGWELPLFSRWWRKRTEGSSRN